jgi:uncharacterized protein (TIGR02391 family)
MAENDLLSRSKYLLQVASNIQRSAITNNLYGNWIDNKNDYANLYNKVITDNQLRDVSKVLFVEEHYALAVEEGYKLLNNLVKTRSTLKIDGADLMRTAFSPKNPFLRINPLQTESQKNQQLGYMDILAGCMTGIRNPRAHEHSYLDYPQPALEMLSLANHLILIIKKSKKTRNGRVT